MAAVHQIAAGAAPRDAITNHLIASRALFRSWGLESEIFAEAMDPSLAGDVLPARDYPDRTSADDLAILHYSIHSSAFDIAAKHADRCAFHYHNITPASYLWRYAPLVAAECARGRAQLPAYRDHVAASWADSRFNAQELTTLGYDGVQSLGILRTPLSFGGAAERDPVGPPRMLFVGRGIPNKAQHDLIFALAALHEERIPATLTLVGSWDASPCYRDLCTTLASRLGVNHYLRMLGSIDNEALADEYRAANLFVCLSDHEGFCVPALEAIDADLPIVAYAAGALPETVGGAGLLLSEKAPSLVAEAVMEVHENAALRGSFADARTTQREHFAPDAVGNRLKTALAEIGAL